MVWRIFFHALVACKAAKEIWKLTHLDDLKEAAEQDMLSLLHGMTILRSKADIEMLVAIFWMV